MTRRQNIGGARGNQQRPRPPHNQIEDADSEMRVPRAPTMARSRVQLATTYAPGVLFTWEGAKGICRSVPIPRELRDIEDTAKLLIRDGIREIASNWLARGQRVRNGVPISLILDDVFYNQHTETIEPNWVQDFQLNDPSVMGYVPFPLLYRCGVCGLLIEFESIADQDRHHLPRRCGDHDARWSQVDVVYVHWSGRVEPLSPFRYNYDPNRRLVSKIKQCVCGSDQFRLHNQAAKFSEWEFVCTSCGNSRDLKQPDPFTLEVLENESAVTGRAFERIEVNMLPVSYRANSAFYPQKGSFIEFRDRSVVDLLTPDRGEDLLRQVAHLHGFAFAEPSDAEIEAALQSAGRSAEWQDYSDHTEMAERAQQRGQTNRAEQLLREAREIREKWFEDAVVARGQVDSADLARAVAARPDWARRYDPIRLTVEHDRFVTEHIQERRTTHEAVDVMEPDRLICDACGNPDDLRRYQQTVGGLLRNIGLEQLVLIRGLPICEFSFGYTRVSSSPIYEREFNNRRVPMPVRLNAFPALFNGKRPIYVTRQKNEALYFRLDAERVQRWLLANGVQDVPSAGQRTIGGAYLEQYQDFGAFLDEFKEREGRGGAERHLPPYVYLLLHSLAHHVMHSLADISGLDRDALGEYIFPADLAFVVYRKGMTPDLGNISAMWRNYGADFLRRMLDARALRCGSGSLCDTRGGACPACVMVSEITCIASNQLLSRASLRGGAPPTWEPQGSAPWIGFFDPRLSQP